MLSGGDACTVNHLTVGNLDGVLSTPELHGSFSRDPASPSSGRPGRADETGPSGRSPHLIDVHGNPMGLVLVQPSLGDLTLDHLSVYIHFLCVRHSPQAQLWCGLSV